MAYPVGYDVTIDADGREGRVVGHLRGETRDGDLYRIEFEDGSTDLFELTDFRE